MALTRRCTFLMAIFLVHPGVPAAQSGAPNGQQAAPGCVSIRAVPPLPFDAEQVAAEIGVLPLVQRLRALAENCASAGGITLEELSLRQQITEAIVAASLDVDEVIAEIGYEQARIAEVRERLSDAKNKKINTFTFAGIIIGSGSGSVGNALGLGNPTARAGLWVQVVGGAGSIVLAILALREQGGKSYLGTAPNMLAALFGRETERSSVYPQDVWSYLNTVPPANPRTHEPWKDELIAGWVQEGRIGAPTAAASQAKIDRITSGIVNHLQLSISDLSDRNAMLSDVRSRVSLMNRDLRDLTKAVSIPDRGSATPLLPPHPPSPPWQQQ